MNESIHAQCIRIINKLQLVWQYPVITELTVCNQQHNNPTYIGLPWATIIDKQIDINQVYSIICRYIRIQPTIQKYSTCCQHVSYKQLIPLFVRLGITHLYISHKIIGLDVLNNIRLYALPLYAVNIEDDERNILYKTLTSYTAETTHSTLLQKKREYIYCFMGAYNHRWYLSTIRNKIFTMKHPSNTFIKNTEEWHFENIVYGKQVGKWNFDTTKEQKNKIKLDIYNTILSKSRYSLCPSGTGPNSIRFWESLAFGSIPILLADTLELPEHPLWDQAIIRLNENKVDTIPTIVSLITKEKEEHMRKKCLQIYDDFKDTFIPTIK